MLEHIKKILGHVLCEVAGEFRLACLTPLYATQDRYKTVTIRETRNEAQMEDGQYLEIACGNCPGCRARRARDWAIRAAHESQMHTRKVDGVDIPQGCFITLTYDDEHLPENGSLNVEDWQKFAKRLRNALGPFRYLQCGEYGGKTGRPHYHACLFGIDFHADREVQSQNGGKITWTSDTLSRVWPKGFTMLAPLNFATASYTAGYVVKKAKTGQWKSYTTVYGSNATEIASLKPEFNTMSRRPGLGTTWLTKYWPDIYPRDTVTIEGKSFRPPKFYDGLLKEMNPVLYEQVMEKRIQHLEQVGPTSDTELRGRRSNFQARQQMYNKREKV